MLTAGLPAAIPEHQLSGLRRVSEISLYFSTREERSGTSDYASEAPSKKRVFIGDIFTVL